MTLQEIFDTVVAHLRKQGKAAIRVGPGGPGCAYRGDDGTMCAVGCLIKDEFYHEKLEGHPIAAHFVMIAVRRSIGDLPVGGLTLLSNLQDIHDTNHWTFRPGSIEEWFQGVAKRQNLIYTAP